MISVSALSQRKLITWVASFLRAFRVFMWHSRGRSVNKTRTKIQFYWYPPDLCLQHVLIITLFVRESMMNTNLQLLSHNQTSEVYVMVYSMHFHVITFTVTRLSSKKFRGCSTSTECFLASLLVLVFREWILGTRKWTCLFYETWIKSIFNVLCRAFIWQTYFSKKNIWKPQKINSIRSCYILKFLSS